jgi:hypothetical protein
MINQLALSLLAVSLLLAGCSSTGTMSPPSATGVQLTGRNYKVLKAEAVGESRGFRLLGLIPFSSPTYSSARKKLYDSVGESLNGRAIALANQTEDRSFMYLILFSVPKLTLTADVIEFTDR